MIFLKVIIIFALIVWELSNISEESENHIDIIVNTIKVAIGAILPVIIAKL